MQQPGMSHASSARSSVTLNPVDVEQYLRNEEKRIEMYGGDDVREPDAKETKEPIPKDLALDDSLVYVGWDGPDDPTNPQNWSKKYRWALTVLCSIMTVNVTFASSAPSASSARIVENFGISSEVSYLVTSLFLVGYVLGPILWGPGSELIGRKPVIAFTMTCYTIFFLGQALAKNIETLLISRFFGGLFGVAPLTIAGGIIADMWSAEGRGPATSLFAASTFLGPVLGPIVGGYVAASDLSWNWIFWVMMIFAGACTALTIAFIPETYAPILLQQKAKKLRKAHPELSAQFVSEHENQDWSPKGVVHRTLFRPFKMLFQEPILALVTVYLSIVYGVLYALFQAFPIVFMRVRGFTIQQSGLIFIGVGIGTTFGALVNVWQSRHYPQLIARWKGFPPPEYRLTGAMVGAPLLVIGAFWLGWTGHYASVPWYVPGLATIVLGAGISLIFMSFLSYLVDTYLMYSASAFAANTVMRSLVGAAFPLFTVQMFTGLGINWACTLVGLVGLLLAPSPFLFYKYGAKIREKSKFAPCLDLKIAKELQAEEKLAKAQV